MKIHFNEAFHEWYQNGGRVPRKIKKAVLQRRPTKRDLRKKLYTLEFGKPIKTMYEVIEINHGAFCPSCGEPSYVGTGNRTSYPEHWEYFKCIRCRKVVGYIDNSPFIHALECAGNNYDPTF